MSLHRLDEYGDRRRVFKDEQGRECVWLYTFSCELCDGHWVVNKTGELEIEGTRVIEVFPHSPTCIDKNIFPTPYKG